MKSLKNPKHPLYRPSLKDVEKQVITFIRKYHVIEWSAIENYDSQFINSPTYLSNIELNIKLVPKK